MDDAATQHEVDPHDEVRRLESEVSKAAAGSDAVLHGVLLANLGLAQQNAGQTSAARDTMTRAIGVLEATRAQAPLADALRNLGSLERDLGHLDVATTLHERALRIYRTIRDRSGEGRALTDLGVIHKDQGAPAGGASQVQSGPETVTQRQSRRARPCPRRARSRARALTRYRRGASPV